MKFKEQNIVIFDDQCMLCNRIFQFLVKNIRSDHFLYFTGSESDCAKNIFKKFNIVFSNNTIYYLHGGKLYNKTYAIRFIIKELKVKWKIILFPIYIFPVLFTNKVYDIISRNRNKFFHNISCEINDKQRQFILKDCYS